MSFFKKLFGIKHPQYNHVLTDEDREHALAVRKAKREAEIAKFESEKMKYEAIAEREQLKLERESRRFEEQYGNQDESLNPDALLMQGLTMLMNKNNPAQQTQQVAAQVKINYSDAVLEDMYGQIPKIYRKGLKKETEDNIKAQIIKSLPQIDEDSLKRAVARVRKG